MDEQITLCFLHGLLGSGEDWQEVIQYIQKNAPLIKCITLDLPFHGDEKKTCVKDFAETEIFIQKEIERKIGNESYWLIGYSLGGRIALDFVLQKNVNKNLQGLILEGANFGLSSEEERKARWANDVKWANRFATEVLSNVLADWYQQKVFSHLNEKQRQALITKRAENSGTGIAQMLKATSLAKQEYFLSPSWIIKWEIFRKQHHVVYICGERDEKFKKLAKNIQIPMRVIPNAGHNSHQENPEAFAQSLLDYVKSCYEV
ncbi:hypothetical protein A6A19_03890 [Actinobacillus delphinicola]|uniref:2-succinyl-6-hydroxy-2, 4-cyclohexadiene-1-carboxylate synthase n=1 Tax=Actinobacillus delphinicola TaxID=51161 RepID=UPI002442633E|nr:2-succinyl-6-hydroxy-2,4-cyclohexadiene-1-carboxylate synthase [Actinobacillus delphinicola]MDG6897159.1 hypothetical protein [Actinobacillus delphinicola]